MTNTTSTNEKKEWNIIFNYSLISALISTIIFGILWYLSNNAAGSALVPLFIVVPITNYLIRKKVKKELNKTNKKTNGDEE